MTVFTPTYNRRSTLFETYQSLKKQTDNEFEWIIVDDGSSDGTENDVKQWIKEGFIKIKFLQQDNSGKHVAQNRALDVAEGELFLPLDSDDTVVATCIEVIKDTWYNIPMAERHEYSGIGCLCSDQNGQIIGEKYPQEKFISNDLEISFKYKTKGEKWGAIRTDVLRKFKNPEVKGHYYPESAIWFTIARYYKKVYINKALRIYTIRDDSVQKKSHFTDEYNAEAKYNAAKYLINSFWDWYSKYSIKEGCLTCLVASKAATEMNKPLIEAMEEINPIVGKILLILSSPYRIFYKLVLCKGKHKE